MVVELIQGVVLIPVGLLLGWSLGSHATGSCVLAAVGVVLLATVAFAGIGLAMAGLLKAEVNLAAANGLYLVLLLLGGMIVPIGKLPGGLASLAKALPADALSAALHAALGSGASVPPLSWLVLAIWAAAAPTLAAISFRWE